MGDLHAPAASGRGGVVHAEARRPPWAPGAWGWRLADAAVAGGALVALGGLVLLLTRGSPADQGATLAVVSFGALSIAVAFRALVEPDDVPFLLRLVLAGFLLRVGLALALHFSLPVDVFAPDQFTFQDVGWRTLRYLEGEGPPPAQIGGTYEVAWFYWNALLFRLFGFVPLAPKIVNATLGVWAGLAAYRLGGEVGGRAGANAGALLVFLMPSLILWSTQNLREAPITLLNTVFLLLAVRLHVRPRLGVLVGLLCVLGLLAVLRDYMAWMAGLALVGSLPLAARRRPVPRLLTAVAVLALWVGAYRVLGFGTELLETASFEGLDAQRRALAFGGTAFAPGVDISTPARGLAFLPLGLSFFLFAPFPWQATSSPLAAMAFPETVLWYVLFLFAIGGALHVLRRYFERAIPVLTFFVLTASVYGLVEGNAGTAYRHRSQLVIGVLVFAAIGIEVWRQRRLARRSGG
ncbi:MAG: glycosyltransferase family 39 protein [Gemmatimonadota bacterium]